MAGTRRRPLAGRIAAVVLGLMALAVPVLGLVPSGAAPAHKHPAPRPVVTVTVGKAAYACTSVPARKH